MRRREAPVESWEEIEAVAERLEPRLAAMVLVAAATGMRPGEWVALEHRDIDRVARVAYVRSTATTVTSPATDASTLSACSTSSTGRRWTLVDARWTLKRDRRADTDNGIGC